MLRGPFFRVSKRFSATVATQAQGLTFHLSTFDGTVGRFTFEKRRPYGFETVEKTIAAMQKLDAGFSLADKVMIDIGANVGTTTIPTVRLLGAGRSLAVEAAPDNVVLLKRNVEANGLASRIAIVHAAASDSDGTAVLELAKWNSGDHRVRVGHAQAGALSEQHWEVVEVPARRLDTILREQEVDVGCISFVLIDAQGHEAHILDGACVLRQRPVPILMEYWPYGLQRAGGLERLHAIVADNYASIFDVGAWEPGEGLALRPARELGDLSGGRDDPAWFTNVLLLGQRMTSAPPKPA